MKSILIGFMLTVSLSTFANTTESVFKKDSVLPTELKEKIIQSLNQNCAKGIDEHGLSEITTQIISQNKIDTDFETVYETVFNSRYHYDYHPTNQKIKVTSSQIRSYNDYYNYSIDQVFYANAWVCER